MIEFREIKGLYTRDILAIVIENYINKLAIKEKLFAITRDNARNKRTLCKALYKSLKKHYNNKSSIIRP